MKMKNLTKKFKQTFINLPVKDLNKSIQFFAKLGFSFNPKFTDKNATCMILGENVFAMLLVEKFFKTFTKKQIVNAKKSTETIIAISANSRQEVDELIKKAINAGGKEFREPQENEFMYGKSFEDLDGHVWEAFFLDETKMPKQ